MDPLEPLDDRTEELARAALARILAGMGIEATIETSRREERLVLNIVGGGEDDSIIIGRKGKTLEAIQLILNRIVFRTPSGKSVVVDVSGYRERRRRNLIETAHRCVQRVKETNYRVVIGPFNAYERHLVHAAVEGDRLVATESVGEGELKKIVFKPRHEEEEPHEY